MAEHALAVMDVLMTVWAVANHAVGRPNWHHVQNLRLQIVERLVILVTFTE